MNRIAPIALTLALAAQAPAAQTTTWELNSWQDFIRGTFQNVSLSRDGRLMIAPKSEAVFTSDQPVIWSVATAPDGTVYAGTGHRGRVYRIDKSGKSSLVWTSDRPEIFALAAARDGAVFAASSPEGKIYRIHNGAAAEYFDPKAKYIWSLAIGPDNALYAGTGDDGKVWRITGAGKGEVYYETGQSHVTDLVADREGRLLAGTEPNGILYRIAGKDKAFVLYDANLPEIRAIVPTEDGTVYAAALGGSVAKRAQAASQAGAMGAGAGAVAAPATTITVTAEAQAGAPDLKQAEAAKQQQQAQQAAQVSSAFTPVIDVAGVEKSAVYRINPDNTVETLWSSKEENVYDLMPVGGHLLLSTDLNGRIYRLTPDRKVTLLLQTNEGEATRLLGTEESVLAATSNRGRIYRLGEEPGAAGSFESPVHDANTAALWGSLSWRYDVAGAGAKQPSEPEKQNSKVVFRTRSGNSARPDKTWSDWSQPLADPLGSKIPSPNARYIQWKAEFAGAGGFTPVLQSVNVAYLPQNTPPVVKTINVTAQAGAAPAKTAAAQPAAAAYTVTVSDTGDAGASAGTPTQTLTRAASQSVNLTWQAEDLDNDKLVYFIYFLGEGEQQWKLLKGNIHENTFTFDAEALADGKYLFRVRASDREANPPQAAREGELTSAPVLIDNTPPVIAMSAPRRNGNQVAVDFEATDSASPLRRCEYSLDAAGWTPVQAADGVVDSLKERFTLTLPNVTQGEHLLVVRAYDAAGNPGLTKLLLK